MNSGEDLDFSDWAKSSWFLDGDDEVFTAMGFTLRARREAALHLARVFTPEVCRDIRANPKRGHGSAVFLGVRSWPGLLLPLMEVGRDLGVVQLWGDSRLLRRLTRRGEFYSAAFELRVLANLILGGYRVERVPEAPPLRTPDLRLQVGLDPYEVELKGVSDSPIDRATDVIYEGLARANLIAEGLHLELHGSDAFRKVALDEPESVKNMLPKMVSAFEECSARIRRGGARPGTYEAGPNGYVLATPGSRFGSFTPAVMPDLPPEKRVNKLVRLVRDAASQFTVRRGVALIEVRRSADMMAVDDAVRVAAAAHPEAFAKCHMVVLADSVRDLQRDFGAASLARVIQVHERRQVSRAQERLAQTLAGRGGAPANLVRPAQRGEVGIRRVWIFCDDGTACEFRRLSRW